MLLLSLSLVLACILNFSCLSLGDKFVHPGPLHTNSNAEIQGHILTESSHTSTTGDATVTLFSMFHRTPILLCDELREAGVELNFIHSDTLSISGSSIDFTDFKEGVVLIFHSSGSNYKNRQYNNTYYKIKRSKIVNLESKELYLLVEEVSATTVISHVLFSRYSAQINHNLLGMQPFRKLHIYGRHGPHQKQTIRKALGQITKQADGSSTELCLTNVYIGGSECDLRLTGEILSFHNDLGGSMASSGKKVNFPNNSLNMTMYSNVRGRFDVMNDKLNFTFQYFGNISSSLSCPVERGCLIKFRKANVVNDFYKSLRTSIGPLVLHLPDGFTFEADMEINLAASIRSRTPFSLLTTQNFNCTSSTQQVFDARIPSPVVSVPAANNNSKNTLFGRVSAGVFIRTRFTDSGTAIANQLKFDVGSRINTLRRTINNKKLRKCDAHGSTIIVYPFMRKISAILRRTLSHIGFENQNVTLNHAEVGPPSVLCRKAGNPIQR